MIRTFNDITPIGKDVFVLTKDDMLHIHKILPGAHRNLVSHDIVAYMHTLNALRSDRRVGAATRIACCNTYSNLYSYDNIRGMLSIH